MGAAREQVVVIAENPKAGSGEGRALVEQLASGLTSHGYQVVRERDPEAIRRLVHPLEAACGVGSAARPACVVCAGGDGTIGMVANWVDAKTPLAVLPLGTENLLAKQLGFDRQVDALVARIASGKTFVIDAGEANGKLFLVVASVGFDAEVVRLLAARRTGPIRHSTWVRPILQALGSYRFPEIRVRTNSHPAPVRTRWAFLFNMPRYALGLRFVAEGDCADGMLDLCCFRGGRWWSGLRYLAGLIAGVHRGWRDTHVEQASWIRIEADEAVPYQLDGDPGGELPLEVRVLPQRLTIVGSL